MLCSPDHSLFQESTNLKKKPNKCKKNGKTKKLISKIKKKQKQNKRVKKGGKKGQSKRKNMGKKWTCPFTFLFAFPICPIQSKRGKIGKKPPPKKKTK